MAYDGTKAVQAINPQFFNYPLPVTGGFAPQDIAAIGDFKFTLKPTSPCIGRGFTNFKLMKVVPVDPKYGITYYSEPGKDIGCYQFDGSGNLHY